MFDIDGGSQPPSVPGDVVGKYDGSHGGLPRAGLAHEQDFLLQGHGEAGWGLVGSVLSEALISHVSKFRQNS